MKKKNNQIGRESEVKEVPCPAHSSGPGPMPRHQQHRLLPSPSSQQVSSAVSLAAFLPLPFSWPKADVIIFNEHLQKLHIKHAAGTGHGERWKGEGRREPAARGGKLVYGSNAFVCGSRCVNRQSRTEENVAKFA